MKFKIGTIIPALYLLLVLVVCFPLIKDVAIHHGNGIAFLAATILTSPLSWLFFWIIDNITPVNAFYVTGWLYLLDMSVIIGCAIFNAAVLYLVLDRLFSNSRGSMQSDD